MVRKAIALAVAAMVGLSGPALAADAKASATKAAAVKADTIQRASLSQANADQATGDYDLWLFLTFGIISTAVIVAAFDDDESPVSP